MIEIKYETEKLLELLFCLNVLWTVVKVNYEELCMFFSIESRFSYNSDALWFAEKKKFWVQRRHTPNMKLIFDQMWSDIMFEKTKLVR
jgi:hypothetical protein